MDKAIASIRFLASLARAAARATFTIITRDRWHTEKPTPRPKGCTENPNTCPHDYATCYPDKPCPWGPK